MIKEMDRCASTLEMSPVITRSAGLVCVVDFDGIMRMIFPREEEVAAARALICVGH